MNITLKFDIGDRIQAVKIASDIADKLEMIATREFMDRDQLCTAIWQAKAKECAMEDALVEFVETYFLANRSLQPS